MSAAKKVPLRMCVSCREMKEKKRLIRVVKNKDGDVFIDTTGKKNGRGAYICMNEECINNAKKKKCFNREFKADIPEDIYNKLKEYAISEKQ